MPIVWREQISVGNNIIDQDHKYLICLINSVELALKHEDTIEYLPVYMRQLVDYTKEHFTREEVIQKRAHYPAVIEHEQAHAEIIAKLEELDQLVKGYIDKKHKDLLGMEEEAELNQRIMELARHWVLQHILKEDKRMEYYLRKLPPNFC